MGFVRRSPKWTSWAAEYVSVSAGSSASVISAYRLEGKTLHLRSFVQFNGANIGFNSNGVTLKLPNGWTAAGAEQLVPIRYYTTGSDTYLGYIAYASESNIGYLFAPASTTSVVLRAYINNQLGLVAGSNWIVSGTLEIN